MRKNLTNKLYVKKQLYSLHMKKGSDLLKHLNMFNMLNTQLSSFGVNYEDEDKALLFISVASYFFWLSSDYVDVRERDYSTRGGD